MVEQDELVDEGAHRFEHQDAHRLGLVEVDAQADRLGVFGDERLDRQSPLREGSPAGAELHQHARTQLGRGVQAWIREHRGALHSTSRGPLICLGHRRLLTVSLSARSRGSQDLETT